MKGYRTIIVNVLTFSSAVLAWDQLSVFIDPQYIVLGQAVINIGMRVLTTTPVGSTPSN